MKRPRHIIVVAAVFAMALTSIGAPASAAGTGKVAIVNGFPGKAIDICINNREYKTGLRYGRTLFRTISSGFKTLRIYSRNAGTCRGQLLAKQSFPFPRGSSHTIVMTKLGPRIQDFDNKDFGEPIPPGPASVWFWRNASDIGEVSLDIGGAYPNVNPITPALRLNLETPSKIAPPPDPVWAKGKQYFSWGQLNDLVFVYTSIFHLADTDTFLDEPDVRLIKDLLRYEWILIGTNPSNARLVFLKRPIPPFS